MARELLRIFGRERGGKLKYLYPTTNRFVARSPPSAGGDFASPTTPPERNPRGRLYQPDLRARGGKFTRGFGAYKDVSSLPASSARGCSRGGSLATTSSSRFDGPFPPRATERAAERARERLFAVARGESLIVKAEYLAVYSRSKSATCRQIKPPRGCGFRHEVEPRVGAADALAHLWSGSLGIELELDQR